MHLLSPFVWLIFSYSFNVLLFRTSFVGYLKIYLFSCFFIVIFMLVTSVFCMGSYTSVLVCPCGMVHSWGLLSSSTVLHITYWGRVIRVGSWHSCYQVIWLILDLAGIQMNLHSQLALRCLHVVHGIISLMLVILFNYNSSFSTLRFPTPPLLSYPTYNIILLFTLFSGIV